MSATVYMNTRWDIIVRYLPSWFPGVQFHGFAKKVREDAREARHIPFEHVANTLKVGGSASRGNGSDLLTNPRRKSGGNIDTSMASAFLENFEDLSERGVDKEVVSTVAAMVYLGEHSRNHHVFGPCPTLP